MCRIIWSEAERHERPESVLMAETETDGPVHWLHMSLLRKMRRNCTHTQPIKPLLHFLLLGVFPPQHRDKARCLLKQEEKTVISTSSPRQVLHLLPPVKILLPPHTHTHTNTTLSNYPELFGGIIVMNSRASFNCDFSAPSLLAGTQVGPPP